jgi:sulfoxide reductase heme-binding subunit YedZ
LCVTLAVTPLRQLFGWHGLVRFRRMLGLFAFFYGTLHFLTYVILDRYAGLDALDGALAWSTLRELAVSVGQDVAKRPFITMGFSAFSAMVPLALTSTRRMIQRLGGRRWQLLHRLIYFSGVAGVVHYYWLVKADIRRPLAYGGVVFVLLGLRAWHARHTSRLGKPMLGATTVFLLLSQAPAAGAAQADADQPIRAFLQVSTDFCTGGQPRPEHFAKLKADGVKSVLNLRSPGEHRAEEEQEAVAKAGLKYFNIPVVYRDPKSEQVDEFLKITDDKANRPMFIHCTAAIRVGTFWLIRRVVRDGWTWDAAYEEAQKVGLKGAPHLEEFAKQYIAAHPK